jgi:hypothetical protein
MHRLTARVLLTLLLVGTMAPLALALSAPAQHACCMRKPMSDAGAPKYQLNAFSYDCCNHDCCRTLTTSRWAQIAPATSYTPLEHASRISLSVAALDQSTANRSHSGRSPPKFSIA